MKQFISVNDVQPGPDGTRSSGIDALVQKALAYKVNPFADATLGKHKRIGCLFLNPSMRTRLSTQVAAQNLGMEAIVFNVGSEGWALEFEEEAIMSGTTVEHVKDAAPVFGKYFDILAIRTFPSLKNREDDYSELYIKQFIKYAGIPVVSLESSTLHPLQSLTDIITITEELQRAPRKKRPKVVLSWAPHVKPLPQCVANSFSQWINAWDQADFVITHPEDYELSEAFTNGATITHNQDEALQLGDRVAVMNAGKVEQVAVPEELYLTPASRFVAEFMGAAFFVQGVAQPHGLETEVGFWPQPMLLAAGTRLEVAARPDDVTLIADPQGAAYITNTTYRGGSYLYDVRLPSGTLVRGEAPHTSYYAPGTAVRVELTPGHALAYFAQPSAPVASVR